MLVEYTAEVQGVFIADNPADFGYRIFGGFQQHLRICDADGDDILHGGGAGVTFEVADKPAYAHAAGCRIVLNVDVRIIIIIKILCCQIHLVI